MSSNDPLSNREAKSCASDLTRASFVYAVEALSQMRQMLDCYAHAGVLHLQQHLVFFDHSTQGNASPLTIIFNGVVQQCQYSLLKQGWIANHYYRFVGVFLKGGTAIKTSKREHIISQGRHVACFCDNILQQRCIICG